MTKARDLSNIISSGTISNDYISLDAAEIPNLDTAKITTGSFDAARIPSLDTAKITSGTFAAARIDNTSLDNVTALPTINAGNLTVDGTDEVGFRNAPVNSQSADYTLVLTDRGKTIFHPSADTNNRTFTIPANASVAYAVGTVLTFSNLSTNDLTIAITTDTLYLAGDGSTGSRTLAQYGVASAVKLDSTTWLISGNGLS